MLKTSLLYLFISTAVLAAETRHASPDVVPPPASIVELAWLAGQWDGEGLGGTSHEIYSPPADGQIVGHFRQMQGGKIQFFELVTIAETEGSLEFRVKHFNADLTGWEDKSEIQRFPLVAMDKDVWYFDGLTLRRDGANGLIITVLVRMKDGTSSELPFRYHRAN